MVGFYPSVSTCKEGFIHSTQAAAIFQHGIKGGFSGDQEVNSGSLPIVPKDRCSPGRAPHRPVPLTAFLSATVKRKKKHISMTVSIMLMVSLPES